MIYSYFFEAKSIQQYLFKTGKVKDIIASSERLDILIDDNTESLLYKVLQHANLTSDLIDKNKEQQSINFIRCKGGAFYCYSNNKDTLVTLRSLWTISMQQMFPTLEFTDALVEAESLQIAIKNGHQQLAADRNTPVVKLPIPTTINERFNRTGDAAIPMSNAAKYESGNDDNQTIDIDTNLHRQAYHNFSMKDGAALQDKFTPSSLQSVKGEPRKIHYPVDLENDFQFLATSVTTKSQKEAIKDMALIHIDGNGLGLLLRALQSALVDATDTQFCQAFRQFSEALCTATQQAAQKATQEIYNIASYQLSDSDKVYVPMRPLVLGGDDVTLLCRADLALKYSSIFCNEFKKHSKVALETLYNEHLNKAENIKPYLTASGGILYHKASHPFVHSHHLVEGLCAKAKQLTKEIDPNVGPAAIAFYRLSSSVSSDIEALCNQSQSFTVKNSNGSEQQLNLGLNAYVVGDEETKHHQTLANLMDCIESSQTPQAGISMTKWRQMATEVALGNKIEADRIYVRAVELGDKEAIESQSKKLSDLAGLPVTDDDFYQWCWKHKNYKSNALQTVITDMLIIDHFSGSSTAASSENITTSKKETA
jgi:hypothetical protein